MEPNETPITPDETPDTTDTTPEEPVSLHQLLARAGRVYDIAVAVALEAAEMDDLPMRGVSVLRRIDEGGAPTALAHVLRTGRISRQHGTQLIDTLVERGYIVREVDPEDRRRMRVALTERGQAAADAVRTAIDGLNAALAEKVTPEQIEASRAVLGALIELAPEGPRPGAEWGPGPDGGDHRGGPGRGRSFGRRGPMRGFDPRGDDRLRERMHAFAARFAGDDGADAREERGPRPGRPAFDEPEEGRPFGPRGRHGCGHRGRSRDRGERAPMVHIDTVIVNADANPRGRGRHGHDGRDRGGRPVGPWRGDPTGPETPQTDPTAGK
ncbi:MAG: winged helix DNA-binding protein [Thermomicrobiales bacterium]